MVFPFRNILFPTDFSVNAQAALKYAAAFARHGQGRVVLFSVQDAKAGGNLQLDEVAADPLLSGVDTERFVVEGAPPGEIAQGAIDHDIDLITLAMRGRNRLSLPFGSSTAEDIIAESPCAVLAVRPPQRDFVVQNDGQSEIQLRRVLLATNFRPSSVAATQLATQMANQLGAELHAVYVIGDYFEQISVIFPEGGLAALTRLRSYVEERMGQLSRGGGETHIAEGRPYQEIVKLADTLQADLIVIGTAVHGSLFGNSQVLGSEIERVIRNAPCPVLCVPTARVVTPLPALVTQIVPQT
ncbi:MAG TPA: universal stress protein [Pyrinomonadaceae bacterium]|nr:universal stress protein [Pyrinomonadaceae bacterium]